MVITVSCPSCSTSFPVDPAKIPPAGVNARCSTCGDIFRVERPKQDTAATAPEPAAAPPPLPPPLPLDDDASDLSDVQVVPPPAPPVAAQPEPAAPPPPPRSTSSPAAAAPATAPSAAPAAGTFRFGKRDPTDKAKRLARVLVSDMIMYNAERHRTALENGTLAADFEDEIEKSWKEYVEQVGSDIAEGDGRQYWREALNDILAKGEKIFH
jgi:predicted Zn finger-like uncharacterized protein